MLVIKLLIMDFIILGVGALIAVCQQAVTYSLLPWDDYIALDPL